MGPETRKCQNCKNEFTIEPADFEFYARLKVPPPTFCPECRMQRRMMFRNARKLYKRKCGLCGKDTLANISPDKPFKVYCTKCWWSDKWDGMEFGQDYDPNRNFFEQLKELSLKIPYPGLFNNHSTLVNSEYVNHAGNLKNCYLIFDADFNENCYYSDNINHSKDCMDCYYVYENQLCYENVNTSRNYNTHFSDDCEDCHGVYFSRDMAGCSDCFGCVGLRRKQYHVFNKPYSKEDYFKKLAEFKLFSYSELEKIKKEVQAFWLKSPQKYMHSLQNVNSSGEYVYYSKNARDCYMASGVEDGRFVQYVNIAPTKDCYDYTEWGNNAQRLYECMTVVEGADSVRFSFGCVLSGTLDIDYSMMTGFCQHIFGCIGLFKKSYCILNKQYSKEDYLKLRAKIIEDMNKNSYVDARGRVWKYGEFLPYDLSFFDYNESWAMYYFPKTKDEVLASGWRWKEDEPITYKITKKAEDLPDDIKDVPDDIFKEIIECLGCKKGFRVVLQEVAFLRKRGFPLPRKCHECRHLDRLSQINPPKFYSRKCALCEKDVVSPFSPEKPDILYCEECYNREVG